MSNQLIGYIRVSTREQSTGRQSTGMEHLQLDKIFLEKASAKSKDRPQLRLCIDYAREGDTVYVYSMDRLARSLGDLRAIIEELVNKDVSVHFIKEGRTYSKDSSDPFASLLLNILGSFAEFERIIMLDRQAEGIAYAKANGTKSGKPFGQQPLSPTFKPRVIDMFNAGHAISHIAKDLGISRGSVYNLLKGQTKTVHY